MSRASPGPVDVHRCSTDPGRQSAWLRPPGLLGTRANIDVAGHDGVGRTIRYHSANIEEGGNLYHSGLLQGPFCPRMISQV